MIVEIDDRSPVPPYEQLRAGIAYAIACGDVPVGERLPSIRQLARDLSLSPNTVVHAYQELNRAGLVEIEGRKGAFVIGPATSPSEPETPFVTKRFVEQALRRGLSRAAVLDEVRQALDEIYDDHSRLNPAISAS